MSNSISKSMSLMVEPAAVPLRPADTDYLSRLRLAVVQQAQSGVMTIMPEERLNRLESGLRNLDDRHKEALRLVTDALLDIRNLLLSEPPGETSP